ncbi:hypothetical protein MPG02_06970 [Helicobacter pylori]|uniref:hypothetical protein n=1 Tax=Helicobacter pylori TaxID=210 RepID=UPI001FD15398|nr:hypothetical protein [Helicobacter pylori]UOS32688.1 hypothetical protein MPG02_06970 [Helicobacter pylori]
MVYFKTFLGWWIGVACKSFEACLLQDFSRSIVLGYGANKGHGMKLKVGSVKVANALLNHLKFLFLGLR